MRDKRKASVIFFLVLLFTWTCYSQEKQEKAQPLNSQDRQAIISEISKLLDQFYVYPEKAKSMEAAVQKKLQSGSYDHLNDPDGFADAVTADMHAVNNDKHLQFHYAPEMAAGLHRRQNKNDAGSKEAQEKYEAAMRRDNYGFRKVERLPGNVGYLDFRVFASADVAGETAIAALNFLANCDAIIVDLRQNGGGDPTQIQLISSYFFAEPTHLNDIYTRAEDKTENFWTLPYVPGRKAVNADLYILNSSYTFSGAEEFSYSMKNLKRATIIGETTGGGAHPTDQKVVYEKFVLNVPVARAINPITKTNWEGTGVTPDVAVPAAQAFDKAYTMALEKLASKATNPQQKDELQWVLTAQRAKLNPMHVDAATMKMYAGVYGERKVTLEKDQLYYQRTGPKYRMIPMTQTVFMLDGLDEVRFEFVVKDGKVNEVVGVYMDGEREPSKRTQ